MTDVKSDSGELERALERYLKVCYDFTYAEMDDELPDADWKRAKESLAESRKSVLDLFERLQNRIAELQGAGPPPSSPDTCDLGELAEHAKDVLARGYTDLEGFARGLVRAVALLSVPHT